MGKNAKNVLQKLVDLVKANKHFFAILLLGLFFRLYKPLELFYYSHDQDLAGWFVRQVVDERNLRLIGQETSTRGIFIGPLYYYLLTPFYLLFGMDPIGGVVMITLLGLFAIISVYFVFLKVFGKHRALIASFIYSLSFYTIFNDREVVPTMPVILWSVWFFYSLWLILNKKFNKGFLISGILIGLIWHINFALVLLLPLLVLSLYLSKKRSRFSAYRNGVIALSFLSLPLILFEIRNGFVQTKGLFTALTTDQEAVVSGTDKFFRTINLLSKNYDGLIWGSIEFPNFEITSLILIGIFGSLIYKRVINKKLTVILSLWLLSFIFFFSFYSKTLSEYYLNGAVLPVLIILTLFINHLLRRNKLRWLGFLALLFFALTNIHKFFNIDINRNGYLYKRALIKEIKTDAKVHDYPCVSISYITSPGNNFGYRYLYYLENLHVNRPASLSPVYTVVFPLRDDIAVDKTYGSIGLIYPDYPTYNKEDIAESCSGPNENLVEPMWGLPT